MGRPGVHLSTATHVRISLVINPASPDVVERLRSCVRSLRREGHEVAPHLTFEQGDGRRLAREAAEAGCELVVAAGGDGTVNEVASGVHDHLSAQAGGGVPEAERSAPRIGIVPLGTGNDLAGALGLPEEPEAALEAAVRGGPAPIDVALLNGECFVNVSTGGVGAEATEEAGDDAKRLLGPLAYFITGVKKFVNLEVFRARFVAGEEVYDGPFLIFAVGNSRRTGGGNWITPRADPGDGLLDVCIVKELPRRDLLRLLPEIRAGRHLDHPAVIYRQVRELVVESEEELSVNVDGEPAGGRTLRYGISPHRVSLSLP